MENFPTGDNPENINQEPEVTEEDSGFETFDKEKAQQLHDEYIQNHVEKDNLAVDFLEKYQTYEDANEALKNIEGQLYWQKVLSKLQAALSQPNATDLNGQDEPKWFEDFIGGYNYPKEDGYYVDAIENDKYDDDLDLANINKRFSVKTSDSYFADEIFPEDTDFSVENKTDNQDVPKRINSILRELFFENVFTETEKEWLNDNEIDKRDVAFKHLDYRGYPKEYELQNILNEIKTIMDDIGNIADLEDKHDLLKRKVAVLEALGEGVE